MCSVSVIYMCHSLVSNSNCGTPSNFFYKLFMLNCIYWPLWFAVNVSSLIKSAWEQTEFSLCNNLGYIYNIVNINMSL